MGSPLLNLPTEVRQEIWLLVLASPHRLGRIEKRDSSTSAELHKLGNALLSTSREIRDEASQVLYQ